MHRGDASGIVKPGVLLSSHSDIGLLQVAKSLFGQSQLCFCFVSLDGWHNRFAPRLDLCLGGGAFSVGAPRPRLPDLGFRAAWRQ